MNISNTVVEKSITSGTHRYCVPEESLAKAQACAPEIGITRLANVTGMDRLGIAVATACRPNSKSNVMAQGKGLSLMAAKVSAMMESIECFHAENLSHPIISGSVSELSQSYTLADVDKLPRADLRTVDLNEAMDWIEATDLFSDSKVLVPVEMVDIDCTKPLSAFAGYFPSDTNGLASGNTLLEAISHAICEVIERDAVALWNHSGLLKKGTTGVRLDSIADPVIGDLIEKVRAADLDISIWNLTSDCTIPVYRALIASGAADNTDPEFGTGCHLDSKVALCRAVTEAAQARATYITGARDDMPPSLYAADYRSERKKYCHLLHRTNRGKRSFGNSVDYSTDTFQGDLDFILTKLKACGIQQALAIDLTKPEFDIPVVKVVVPGLEGMDDNAAYTPGKRIA
ncbi:MAG: YcaO-like family protein [Gammaproteobacteria bacterium]|nr:YcaO-like family protein [Gammaproteobacteria bacterium]